MVSIRKFESLSLIRDPKTPYLQYRYTLKDGPRCQRSTKETIVRLAWEVAMARYEDAKKRAKGEEPEPTVSGLVAQWVKAHTLGWSPSHTNNIERFGRLHLNELAEIPISQVSTKMAEDARNAFLETHAKGSANLWTTYLRLVYKWAITRGMLRFIPWGLKELKTKSRRVPRLPSEKTEDWQAEVDALTKHEPAIGMVIRLMLGIGLRSTEATHSRWEWLDLEHEEYTPGDTKGGEAWARPVPLWLIEDLKPLASMCGPMVPTMDGKLVTSGRVQHVMDLACEAVNIPRLTPHKLRHTYATWLSEEGVPIQDIQAMLGHKDIETTMRYLGIDLSRVRRAQERLAIRLKVTRRKDGGLPPTHAMGA